MDIEFYSDILSKNLTNKNKEYLNEHVLCECGSNINKSALAKHKKL